MNKIEDCHNKHNSHQTANSRSKYPHHINAAPYMLRVHQILRPHELTYPYINAALNILRVHQILRPNELTYPF